MWFVLISLLLLFLHAAAREKVAPRACPSFRHVHLAVGRDPSTSMTVTFASSQQANAVVGGVWYGTSPGQLNRLSLEDSRDSPTQYNVTQNKAKYGNFGTEGLYVSPNYHHVTLKGMAPDTVYYYRPEIRSSREEFLKSNGPKDDDELPGSFSTLQEMEGALEHSENTEEEEHDRELSLLRPYDSRVLLTPYDGSENACPSPDRIRSFRTAPPEGPTNSIHLAIVGDLGQFPHSEELLLRMERDRREINAMLLVGDIAYTQEDHRRWDTFFDFLDDYPLVDRVPLMICPGNHDIDKNTNDDQIFLGYENRFRMPYVKQAELGRYDGPLGDLNMDAPPYPLPYEWGNAYYSFTYGPAKIIMISVYSSLEPDSVQYSWIQSELASVDRTKTPWLLVAFHTPIYNTFSLHKHDLQIVAAREHLEPLLIEHKANMIFTGHIHAYQRTSTVALEEVTPTGPMHITVGAGGRKCEAPFKQEEPEEWIEVRDATYYGYGMLRIENATTAYWDWIHTGRTDGRIYNQIAKSNVTLPSGPALDHVQINNQFYL